MIITKTSMLTGQEHSMDLPVTQEQLDHWKSSGAHVQDVFPKLSADEREFLMTGSTSEEWDKYFSEE